MLVLSNFEMDTSEKKKFAPRIYPTSRNIDKTWFIKYKELDYITGVPKSHKYYGALNLTCGLEEREVLAKRYVEMIECGEKLPSFQGRKTPNIKEHPQTISAYAIYVYDVLKVPTYKQVNFVDGGGCDVDAIV